jgi:hypothetical protein
VFFGALVGDPREVTEEGGQYVCILCNWEGILGCTALWCGMEWA